MFIIYFSAASDSLIINCAIIYYDCRCCRSLILPICLLIFSSLSLSLSLFCPCRNQQVHSVKNVVIINNQSLSLAHTHTHCSGGIYWLVGRSLWSSLIFFTSLHPHFFSAFSVFLPTSALVWCCYSIKITADAAAASLPSNHRPHRRTHFHFHIPLAVSSVYTTVLSLPSPLPASVLRTPASNDRQSV